MSGVKYFYKVAELGHCLYQSCVKKLFIGVNGKDSGQVMVLRQSVKTKVTINDSLSRSIGTVPANPREQHLSNKYH